MKKEFKVIFFPAFLVIMKELENNNAINLSQLGVKCSMTYSHITHVKKVLIERKLVEIKKIDNRCHSIVLTDKGKKIVEAFNKIITELQIGDIKEYRYGGKRK